MANFITYTYEEHLITVQNKAEKVFLEEFEKKSPTLELAHVIVNPYLISPLTALILFKTDQEVIPTLTVHGKNNARENIVKSFDKAKSHAIPVLGLYEGIKTKVSIELSSGEKKEFYIQADALPEDVCHCRNIMTSIDYFGTDLMFLAPEGGHYPIGFDYKGEIRWLFNISTMFDIKRLRNGNILTGSHRFSRLPYHATGLFEMNLLGKVIHEYRLPNDYHHDEIELEDGNIMVLTQDFSEGSTTADDGMALIDRKTGNVLKTWDYKTFLPQDQGGSGSQDPHHWFLNNALWIDEKSKSAIISGRHQDAIVSFNYETNQLNWIIGDPEGWSEDMQKYFFKPVGDLSEFSWQYEQHSSIMLPNGDIMAFDNGHYRSKNKNKYIKNRDNYSRGVRWRIDVEKMEIEQVWQFGKELGQGFFSPFVSNIEYYDEGHYLIHSGGMATVDGYPSEQLPSFIDKSTPNVDKFSRTFEEKDGVVRYFLETPRTFFRAERLSLYHDKENISFGEGTLLGELDTTITFDTIPDAEEVMEVVPVNYKITINEEEDKFIFHGEFISGSLVMVLLEGKETRAYYINTAAMHFAAMCSSTFLAKSERAIKQSINKQGLSGKYEIKVIIDNKKYQTGVSIFC